MNTNNLQKENLIITNNDKENIYFKIIYRTKYSFEDETKIFDNSFIKRNKDKCKIIYKNKEYELKEYFENIDNNYKNKKYFSFILKINKNINNLSNMFYECHSLFSIRDMSLINNFNNNNISIINDMEDEINLSNENNQSNEIFNLNENCDLYKGLENDQISSSISTIINNNTNNNFLTNHINSEDNNLLSSLKNYNFDNISNLSCMFYGCSSLISLPDLSKWNTSNINDMRKMFKNSLILSKWKTSNIFDVSKMFNGCVNLIIHSNINSSK